MGSSGGMGFRGLSMHVQYREKLMRLESAYLFVGHGPKLTHAQSKRLIFNFAMEINKSKEQNRDPDHV